MTLQQSWMTLKHSSNPGARLATLQSGNRNLHRATEELRQSGLAERALKTGDRAPTFTLNNQDRTSMHSAELLAKGPLVITFFRGHW
jgi:hypothetical protein